MYKTVLVEKLIEDGAKLLTKLDNQQVPVLAATWFYDPDRMAWQFVVVTPVASNPGPLEAYMQIQYAMTGLDLSLSLSDVIVMSPKSRKFEEFKRAMEGVAHDSLLESKNPPQGVVFDDAYIYRWFE